MKSSGGKLGGSPARSAECRKKAQNRKTNEHHQQALLLAGMIAHQLGMRIAQRIVSTISRERLSDEKLSDLLAVGLIKARDLAELITFHPDPRDIVRDKRTRKYPVRIWHLSLNLTRMAPNLGLRCGREGRILWLPCRL